MNINELKVGDTIEVFNDTTIFTGNDDDPFPRIFHSNYYDYWDYKVRYCSSDYVILEILGDHDSTELYILNNYKSIEIYDECNK